MNTLVKVHEELSVNLDWKKQICFCSLHGGDLVEQAEIILPNRKPVVVMRDWQGYHVAIGCEGQTGRWFEDYAPKFVSGLDELKRIINEALQ